jgi:phage N-6-adenine-methyltransferase
MTDLIRYDAACKALAEAKAVDDVLDIRNQGEGLRAYARQAKNKQLELDATEIRIRAERRVGELMAAQRDDIGLATGAAGGGKKDGPRGSLVAPRDTRPTLDEAGIDKHLADRARKLAKMPDETFEAVIDVWRESSTNAQRVTTDVLATVAHVSQNTGDTEWFTPREIVERSRRVLGGIDLDPASTEAANAIIKADRFYTEADDGLHKPWAGRVWMNPPYAQPLISKFCERLVKSFVSEDVTAAIVLVNNATDTQWFQNMAGVASAVCFPCGRIRFWHPDKARATPLQGQAVLYFGTDVEAFSAEFNDEGVVLELVER